LPLTRPRFANVTQQALLKVLFELGGISDAVVGNEELLALVLPIIRDDFELAEGYEFAVAPQLTCPILVFGGQNDPWVGSEELDAWRWHTTGSFFQHDFPGSHFFINTARNELIETLLREGAGSILR